MKISSKLRRFRISRIIKNEIGMEAEGQNGVDLKWHAKEPKY